MADKTSFNQEWNNIHQAFWQGHEPIFSADIQLNDWLKSVDDCWKSNADSTSQANNELYTKLFSSSQFFMNFSTPLITFAEDSEPPNKTLVRYLEYYLKSVSTYKNNNIDTLLNKKDEGIKETNKKTSGAVSISKALKQLNEQPFVLWHEQFNFIKNDYEKVKQSAQNAQEGISTQSTDKDKFTSLWVRFLMALLKYQSAYVINSLEALNVFRKKLNKAKYKHFTMQDICSLCLEQFEIHYAGFVQDQKHSILFANVINSWMQVFHYHQLQTHQ